MCLALDGPSLSIIEILLFSKQNQETVFGDCLLVLGPEAITPFLCTLLIFSPAFNHCFLFYPFPLVVLEAV